MRSSICWFWQRSNGKLECPTITLFLPEKTALEVGRNWLETIGGVPWSQQRVFLLKTCRLAVSPKQSNHTELKSPVPPPESSDNAQVLEATGLFQGRRLSTGTCSLPTRKFFPGGWNLKQFQTKFVFKIFESNSKTKWHNSRTRSLWPMSSAKYRWYSYLHVSIRWDGNKSNVFNSSVCRSWLSTGTGCLKQDQGLKWVSFN